MSALRRDLDAWCGSQVDGARVSAISAVVSRGEEMAAASAGEADRGSALFDLASLTKPFSATLALVLDQGGDLPLSTRLGDVWQEAAPNIAAVSLDGLLRHESGLRRWMPLYAVCDDPVEVAEKLIGGEWVVAGQGATYSDLDYILWCLTVEKALERSYEELLRAHVLSPLELDGVTFTPVAAKRFSANGDSAGAAAPCHLGTGREVELALVEGLTVDELPPPDRGVAQDGNCRFMGRPVGHAGVFAAASALWRLGREWCQPGKLLSPETVERALSGNGRFALGWYRSDQTAAGRRLGAAAFGHDGFTGGTIWVDPRRSLVIAVLCHRLALEVDLSAERARLAERLTAA